MQPVNRTHPRSEEYAPTWHFTDIPLFLINQIQNVVKTVFGFIQDIFTQLSSCLLTALGLGETHKVTPICIFEKDSKEAKAIATLITMRATANAPFLLGTNTAYNEAKATLSELDALNVLAHIKYSPDLIRQIHDHSKSDWTPFTRRLSAELKEQNQTDLLRRAELLTDILTQKPKLREVYLKDIKGYLANCDGKSLFEML